MSSVTTETKVLDILIDTAGLTLDRWLAGVANAIAADIVLIFNTSPPGREYRHGSIIHIASISPYPPNVDTGALRASIAATPIDKYTYWIHDGVEYGKYLEFGTESIAPRPFMIPVANEWLLIKLGLAVKEIDFLNGA